jgi:hypothetical protein
MPTHLSDRCGKRSIICQICGQGQDGDIWADEMSHHLSNKCPKRRVGCPLMCTGEEMCPIFVEGNLMVLNESSGGEAVRSRGGESTNEVDSRSQLGLAMQARVMIMHYISKSLTSF